VFPEREQVREEESRQSEEFRQNEGLQCIVSFTKRLTRFTLYERMPEEHLAALQHEVQAAVGVSRDLF
jgi:hypothetical protein